VVFIGWKIASSETAGDAAMIDDGVVSAERLFRRRYSDGGGLRAAVDPFLHTLYIPGLVPAIGADLVEYLSSLRIKEMFLHELMHLATGTTRLGAFLKQLVYAIHLALYTLGTDLTLRIPTWQIEGNTAAARVFPKAPLVLSTLEPMVRMVDEVLRTTQTVITNLALSADKQITLDDYHSALAQIQIALASDADLPGVWSLCDRLLRVILDRSAGRAPMAHLHVLVQQIESFVFEPPAAHLAEWWHTGIVPPQQTPLARLTAALQRLEATPDDVDAVDRALEELTTEESGPRGSDAIPDPLADAARAFGLDPDTLLLTHPVGRAIVYLHSGYLPSPDTGDNRDHHHRTVAMIVPLIERSGVGEQCRCEVRIPSAFPPGVPRGDLHRDTLVATLEVFAAKMATHYANRLTIMPLSPEATLLWNLHTATQQLLGSGRLRCRCVDSWSAARCRYRPLIAQITEHTRVEAGDRLPPTACSAFS
jgi:hypothetical protein